MGRKRKLGKGLEARKEYDRTKSFFIKQPKSLTDIFEVAIAKKIRREGIFRIADLQDICVREPKKLLTIPKFGPVKVKKICDKVGVEKSINELYRIYRKIEKKTPQ